MPWVIKPAWNATARHIEKVDDAARLWRVVRMNDGATARRVEPDGRVWWGTKRPGEIHRGRGSGYLQRCVDCEKEFWTPDPAGLFCVACELLS